MLSQDLSAFWVRDLMSLRWYASINLPYLVLNLNDFFFHYFFLITHSVLWGIPQFMHYVEKYFIK